MATEESSGKLREFDPSQYVFTQSDQPVLIKSRTVLPARRENFEVTTADGKRLVGELALPEGDIKATLVTFHPLPTHGGYMDSHVYKKASATPVAPSPATPTTPAAPAASTPEAPATPKTGDTNLFAAFAMLVSGMIASAAAFITKKKNA